MIQKNNIILYLILGSLVLISCQTVPPIPTPSGRPEIVIPNVSKDIAIDYLVNLMISKGYKIKQTTNYKITFKKKNDKYMAALLFGSRYDGTPENRISFNLINTSSGIRIITSIEIITNPNSAFERVTDWSTGKAGHIFHEILIKMKHDLKKTS